MAAPKPGKSAIPPASMPAPASQIYAPVFQFTTITERDLERDPGCAPRPQGGVFAEHATVYRGLTLVSLSQNVPFGAGLL